MKTPRRRSEQKRRDRDAYEKLAQAEHASIINAAYMVTGDIEVAREVTQDAFAELFVHWHKVRSYDKPGAWLRRVAIRKAVKVTQRDRRRVELHARNNEAGRPTESETELLPMLDQLSPNQRAAIYLHYYEDVPVAEVASILGCKPATASVHLNRGRQRLGDLLAPTKSGPDSSDPESPDSAAIEPEAANLKSRESKGSQPAKQGAKRTGAISPKPAKNSRKPGKVTSHVC